MLRGLDGIVEADMFEQGRFYVTFGCEKGTKQLTQCVKSEDEGEQIALMIALGESSDLWFDRLPQHGSAVLLPKVYMRFAPFDAIGDRFCTNVRAGMIFVAGQEVAMTVTTKRGNYTALSLSNGRLINALPNHWIAFSSVSFVIDEGINEKEIGRYKAKP